MLIPPVDLRRWFKVSPDGVLHVGAHHAEEFEAYKNEGFGAVTWVEGQEQLIPGLRSKIRGSSDAVFQAIVWSEDGLDINLNISNNGQSSSVYELEEHSSHYPSIIYEGIQAGKSKRLDSLIPESRHFDFVNLDIQGAELEALRGLGRRLHDVSWIYSEVNRSFLYSNIPMIEDLDRFLASHGFARVAVVWTRSNWGDALYVRSQSIWKVALLQVSGMAYGISQRIRDVPPRMLRVLKRLINPVYSVIRPTTRN